MAAMALPDRLGTPFFTMTKASPPSSSSKPKARAGKPQEPAEHGALPVVFSHANSFALPTYRLLLGLLAQRGIDARGVERFGHNPELPVSNNWPHLVEQLRQFTHAEVQRLGEPVFLVGHSLGGFLSVLVAAKYPELARGVVMLDSPRISGWKANAFDMVKRTPLAGEVTPGKVSRRRRNTWESTEEALDYFRSKKAFAQWHPQMLKDYVDTCLLDDSGKLSLYFTREVETEIYNTLPSNLGSTLRRHPLQCPASFIGARGSHEIRLMGMELTRHVTRGRINMVDGSHLFPMERPEVTAAAIEAALLNMALPG